MAPEIVSAIAAVASSIAAIVALIVVWRSPIAAAKYAENLRLRSEKQNEVRRQKLLIFSELMKARGIQINRESVAAFNLIDVIFIDSPHVKDAWAELYSGYNRLNNMHPSLVEDRLLKLLQAVADDLGLSEKIRSADFERYYYPKALHEEDRARSLQQRSLIGQMEQFHSGAEPKQLFPPRPDRDS